MVGSGLPFVTKNMNKQNYFDVIVIGAGAGGLNVASFMNSIGAKVLLIDKSAEHIGGDCLNAGCIPSKALIHIARQFQAGRAVTSYGARLEGEANVAAIMDSIRAKQAIIREHESAEYFTKKGMTVVLGEARFVGTRTVAVGGVQYTGKKIVLATGSRPRQLTIPGVEAVVMAGRLHTNETIFGLATLPKRLLVIGGGPIGVELGQAFLHLGAAVTVVTTDKTIVPREDLVVSNILTTALIKEGMQIVCEQTPVRFENETTLITTDLLTGTTHSYEFDAVLVAIGREVATKDINLPAAGIAINKSGGIVVDKYLRTTNHSVYVCGDVVGQQQFTHAAELHAGVVIRNLLTPWKKKSLVTDTLSAVTYTTPEVATYGLSPRMLAERGISYTTLESSFGESDRAITDEATSSYTKMYIETKTKRILGGTMIAPQAGELVQELILATSSGLSTSALFQKIYPYPTATRINKIVVMNEARKRLTPFVRRALRWLYRLGI
jgi:pyruvate/2-oxoglutarate dehydrogenase complex dihydrolipoamide dehydrogenase (E3) component